MKKLLFIGLISLLMSCSPSVMKNVSTEGITFIGTDIYYNQVMIARLSTIEYAWDNKKLVREMTYTIIDENYNHLAINIIKFSLNKSPKWEIEVEIKR
jgi:hypothetical protein